MKEEPYITLSHDAGGRVRLVIVDGSAYTPEQIADALRDVAELRAWQEKVCAIIQPAENADEWGADVADIIKMRERKRKALLKRAKL